MGVISVMNTDRLLWLGRYSERVYTLLRIFSFYFDRIIDKGESGIAEFCARLDIPNIYKDGEDFVERYCFDLTDPNSIAANLDRAYGNAITLREEIGTEAVSYIQLAVYELENTRGNRSPMLGLQRIMDNILAFWGITEDLIQEETVRNLLKVGKRIERVDLYARMQAPLPDLQREVYRLADRLGKIDSHLHYSRERLEQLKELAKAPIQDWNELVCLTESILEE